MKFLASGIVLSTITYFLQALAVFYLVVGFGESLTLEQISVIFTSSNFIAALSMIPAGIGVFDGGMVGLFVLNGLEYNIAVTVTILTRLMGIGLFSAIGMIFLHLVSREK